ncbi:DUF4249 family protein [Litoribacter populi]|uniref:DUF4249 family protein n=1 Tax=Litoribacter populi TaxID=2598460 RepID=UPI00117C7747|nr:DUF4249 family protein [Litoribacter populi]
MKHISAKIIYFLVAFSFSACIDEVPIQMDQWEKKLVVDGWLSNDPNLTYIKVYYAQPFQSGQFNRNITTPSISKIYVESETGGEEIEFEFVEQLASGSGRFLPKDTFEFRYEEKYRLNFFLEDNSHYQSPWQNVVQPPNISEVKEEVGTKLEFRQPVFGAPFPQNVVSVDINAVFEQQENGPAGYYFKTSGIEEVYTRSNCEYCVCTCYIHYDILNTQINIVEHPENLSEATGTITTLPMTRLGKFFLEVGAYGLNEEQTKLMQQIYTQQSNTGTIFDPMPFRIQGNIRNLDDDNEEVLGTFSTASFTEGSMIVDRLRLYETNRGFDYTQEALPEVGIHCLEYFQDEATIYVPEQFQGENFLGQPVALDVCQWPYPL